MGLKEEMMHDIEKLSHAVRINYTDSLAAKQVFFRLIARIREILKKTGLSEQDLTGTDSTLEQEFSRKETLDDAAQWFSVIISDAVELMQNSTDTTRIAEAARNIIQYIDENISNKNISLNDIGDAVGLSPSYVSKVFKECYGYNYLEYLSRGRISRAVEYLKEDTYSISEIADMVGFASTQSFLRVFQKYQKTTPGKFRRNLRSSEDVQHEK
jgi:AraC-like DNA-binding protein